MEEKNKGREKKEKREKRKRGERSSNFSLRYTKIGGSVFVKLRNKDHLLDKGYTRVPKFVGPRNKDHLLYKGYAWVSKTRGFAKDSSEEFGKSRVSGLGSVHGTS